MLEAAAKNEELLRAKRILVVDYQEIIGKLFVDYLKSDEVEAIALRNNQAAFDLVRRDAFL